MRKEDIDKLSKPYNSDKKKFDRRFNSAIEADVPSAEKLVEEIFGDFDSSSYGIRWWNSLPTQERILIGDYLYQCANGIETNLAEAKLHYLEWCDAKEKSDERIVNAIFRDSTGNLKVKMPPSQTPLDDLSRKLESLHICGFFRAIGSTLDCLGASIIAVLALPVSLRRSDIAKAEKALLKVSSAGDKGSQLQLDFKLFFEIVKKSSGAKDWLDWVDQYRNMYVHRGRRTTFHKINRRKNLFYDQNEQLIPRAESTTHLAKYPDRSDIEALIKSKDIHLNEDAAVTLAGIFKSCRSLNEDVCERLLSIWIERRNNPLLLEQPKSQWLNPANNCDFNGYDLNAKPIEANIAISNPTLYQRVVSASVNDANRNFWDKSKWS